MDRMEKEIFKIEILGRDGASRALAFYDTAGFAYRDSDRAVLAEAMESGQWTMLMATQGGVDIGGCYLNREPKYGLYRRLRLPELQDLRVLPEYRRRGVGEGLIQAAENLAQTEGFKGLGLSVGLNATFGAAQRLYIRMGYMPDGQGVTYNREVVAPAEKCTIDDDLALMLLKHF
ncbi:MAG: GNAT family N-acetyltransferase [Alphaproteobacteria bacterium]|nr:GNAT family N-acetyltransferase [Alphaproteobacteria bacterium]